MIHPNHPFINNFIKKFIPIYLLFLLSNVFAQGNSSKLYGEQEFILEKTLQKYHYNPVALNDSISKKILNNFIESLDPFGLYFNKKENFDKLSAAFDKKTKSERTKELVDEFNKAVSDFNKTSNEFNDLNNELNTKRNNLITKWNNVATSLLDKHVPKYK